MPRLLQYKINPRKVGLYKIHETEEFLKRLDSLDLSSKLLLRTKVRQYLYPQIQKQPRFGVGIKKLLGDFEHIYRYQICGFRIFYTLSHNGKTAFILSCDMHSEKEAKKDGLFNHSKTCQ